MAKQEIGRPLACCGCDGISHEAIFTKSLSGDESLVRIHCLSCGEHLGLWFSKKKTRPYDPQQYLSPN